MHRTSITSPVFRTNEMTIKKPVIVVLDDWEDGLRRLVGWQGIEERATVVIYNKPLSKAALHQALLPAQCVVLMRDRTAFDRDLIQALPQLRCIVFTGTRNNKLDIDAAREAGIFVGHTEWGPSKASTCEMTWSLILAARKQLADIALSSSHTEWRNVSNGACLPGVLEGQRLGLVGLGQIGQRVAMVGKALGMDVVTWSPNMTAQRAHTSGVQFVSLDELLSTSSVVSLHLVPSPQTRRLLNRERLRLMQPGSMLVNTSRADLVDTDALVQALKEGRPGFAALDVYDTEPLDSTHDLLTLNNVLLTPHYGFVSEPVYRKFAEGVQANLLAWFDQGSVALAS